MTRLLAPAVTHAPATPCCGAAAPPPALTTRHSQLAPSLMTPAQNPADTAWAHLWNAYFMIRTEEVTDIPLRFC
eukprot:COSAG01_NODE_1836_length_9084_cov_5.216472_9_plen_74_part_00